MNFLTRPLQYLKPYPKQAIWTVILIVLSSATALLVPWPLKILVDNALGDHPHPVWLAWLFGGEDRSTLVAVAVLGGLGIALALNGITVLRDYIQTRLQQRIVLDFRSEMFQHAQRLSLAFHDQKRTGELIYAINSLGDAVVGLIMFIPSVSQSLITLIGMLVILLMIDTTLALVAMSVMPFMLYLMRYYANRVQKRLWHVKKLEGESLSIVQETMAMLRVIVAFGRELHQFKRFREHGMSTINARVNITVRQALFSLAVNMTTAIGTAAVLWLGASHVLNGKLSVGDLLVVISYIAAVYRPLEAIAYSASSIQANIASQKIAFELLDTEPEVRDKPDAKVLTACQGGLVFEQVSFHYDGRHDTLKDVSFKVEPGQSVAIVGPTGAGKTTLISLMPRFCDPTEGRILLDGNDTRDLTLASLRDQISMVQQEPLLFSCSIADNIRYGRLDASDDEVMEAARAANAHDFIQRLPKQYETVLGDRGARLSGGERQRLCVARAFLKQAPILLLDEPTSAIDSKTEAVILEALDRLMVGRTSFMIAHRLSTIHHADQILVMEHGQLVQAGTHDSLMEQGGLYRNLYDMQSRQAERRIKAREFFAQAT